MIDPVTGWFELTQNSDKKAMIIVNLVEITWLVRYSCSVEITYDQGGEFLGHDLKKSLLGNEYGIKTKPVSPRNSQVNAIV